MKEEEFLVVILGRADAAKFQEKTRRAAPVGGGAVPCSQASPIGLCIQFPQLLGHIIPGVVCAVTSEYQLSGCIQANLCPWKCMEASCS